MVFYGILMTVTFVSTLWKKQEFNEQVDLENIGLNKMKQFSYYKYFKNLEYANRYHKPPVSSSMSQEAHFKRKRTQENTSLNQRGFTISEQYNGDVGAAGKPQKAQHYSQNFADFNFYFSKQPHEIPFLTNKETEV